MLNIEQIKEIIPHRYPFLLVDKGVEIEPQKRCVAIKNVTANEPFFPGHFPEKMLMPGVLILEAMAQAAAITVKYENEKGGLGVFAGVDNCKFRGQVGPGDTLRMEIEITRLRSSLGKATGKAYVGEELACEAELTFAILPE